MRSGKDGVKKSEFELHVEGLIASTEAESKRHKETIERVQGIIEFNDRMVERYKGIIKWDKQYEAERAIAVRHDDEVKKRGVD